jgi:hypothetical protein
MAITAQLADGTRLEFPDGTDPAVIQRTVKSVIAKASEPQQSPPASVRAGSALRDIPRQVGLTARYGLEGLGQIADIGAEPIRALLNIGGERFKSSAAQLASKGADALGLPSPQGANERTIGDAARMVAGAGGMAAGLGRAAVGAAPGVAKSVMQALASNPGAQAAGAAGAGLAGGSVREAGGGPLEQFGAAVLGGVAGGLIPGAAATAGKKITQALTPKTVQLERADQQIAMVLNRSGIDWGQVPERIKQGMRQEVADAIGTGQPLSPDALRRLLVFRRAEVTPTVGQLTQDPGMISREKNLAKTGANSTNPALQALPSLENRNVLSLLRQLDEAGAAPQQGAAMRAGSSAVNALDQVVTRERGNINALYSQARDTSGRSLPLEGGTFTRRANELLDQNNVGSFLPPDLVKKMNAIAGGEYPLTVDVAEQLKTSAGNIARGATDGNVRRAVGLFRQALDETPLQGQARINPGNMPAIPGAVPPSVAAGEESIAAFNAARRANRDWMRRIEANPALGAVVDGVEPDKFVQRFVIGDGATAADVRALRSELDPGAVQQMRAYLIRHLKDKATGGDEDIVKFGGKTYRDALRALDAKLPAFFSSDEIQKLRDLGDAAKYMQAQPAGSAVNNSNSGALVIGRGLDMLEAAGRNVPFVGDSITGVIQGMQQRQVMAPRNALLQFAPNQNKAAARMNPLLAAAVASSQNNRKDDSGN